MSTIRLHGYPVSNYVNIVRAALSEKALSYDFVMVGAAQDDAFLAMNPMGKIPVLEDDGFCLGETVAILDYLDDRYREPSLRPADIFKRARGRQIANIVQMYVEAPSRSLFPGVFMGGANSPEQIAAARTVLDRSTAALRALLQPGPFLLGHALSQVDLFAFYNLDIADRLGRFVWGRSIIAEAGITQWHEMIAQRDSSRAILAAFDTHFTRYLADKGASYVVPASGIPAHA